MKTKEELQATAQLIRILEAACAIPYPTPQESNFRLAVMKRVAQELNLKELRSATITIPPHGPATRTPDS